MCGKVVKKLILGTDAKVDEKILQHLTPSQIDGVRFLYWNYENHKGSIIAGPNCRFYNEWIIISLIYAIVSNKNRQCRKPIIIITKSEGKKLTWVNFFQNLLPDVCTGMKEEETKKEDVLDEVNYLDKELDSKIIRNCFTKVPCVFASNSETSLLNDLYIFHKIVKYCRQEVSFSDPHEFINTFCSKEKRKKLRAFIKPFYLEIFWKEVKYENLSDQTKELNSLILNANNSDTTLSDNFDTAISIPKISPVEAETCNMSPLQFENKSDDIYNADTQPYISCKVTTQSVYGQESSTWSSTSKISEELQKNLSSNTSIDLFKDSIELEEIASSKEVIVISSGSTIARKSPKASIIINRCTSSEDLFSDVDNEDDSVLLTQNKQTFQQQSSELDSPIPLSLPSIKALECCNTKISTPIAQLVNNKAFQDSESPIGFLSPNFWNESKKKNSNESVFEITKNDVFSNVLRVNEYNEISPVTERQKPFPKFDWSAFTNSESPLKEIPKKEPETSPIHKLNDSSLTHTPTSKRTTTPSDNASSSKKVFKSEDGWLNKYSPKVVPITPKNRRKRLETLFNEISTPITNNLGQDILMSPTDLFE
ncbi:uncharacterized protein LOC134830513 isoform X2 [Culicoides brevitarsis]|uniref:uncharacterized protein LOC134830513 isoform X2 n=1 Tax=Culicoides brevitarsis TaxID=469753 RepID=UPI00307CC42A